MNTLAMMSAAEIVQTAYGKPLIAALAVVSALLVH